MGRATAQTAVGNALSVVERVAASKRWRLGIGAAVTVLVLAGPLYMNDYNLRVATTIAMIAVLATSWNVIAGFCGYLAFGNVAFFGLGAYAVAVGITELSLSYPVALALGVVLAAVVATVFGFPLLRLRGHYFAIATLALLLATVELFNNFSWVGGTQGISVPLSQISPDALGNIIYYAMVGVLALALLTVFAVSRSRLGFAMRAIRADEAAASTLGINTTFHKVVAFVISAVFPALVGGVYVQWVVFIDPSLAFDLNLNLEFVMAGLLGGLGSLLGPLLGAVVLGWITEFALSTTSQYHLGLLGIAIVLVILFLPNGIVSLGRRGAMRRGAARRRRSAPVSRDDAADGATIAAPDARRSKL